MQVCAVRHPRKAGGLRPLSGWPSSSCRAAVCTDLIRVCGWVGYQVYPDGVLWARTWMCYCYCYCFPIGQGTAPPGEQPRPRSHQGRRAAISCLHGTSAQRASPNSCSNDPLHGAPRSQLSFNNCLILNAPGGLVTPHKPLDGGLGQGLIERRLGEWLHIGRKLLIKEHVAFTGAVGPGGPV